MSAQLQSTNLSLTILWEDNNSIAEIRKLFAPKLTDGEFQVFVGIGKATGLNPFLREIWAVKYKDNTPAQIFIGRDGYRKIAQTHSDYEWHEPDSIYENDVFEKINGEIHHKYNLKDRGELIGAYCLVKRKSSAKAICVRVSMTEYNQNHNVWASKPETMIKKVAEAQALRLAFQDILAGTYSDSEFIPETKPNLQVIANSSATQTDKLNSILDDKLINKQTGEIATNYEEGSHDTCINEEQLNTITRLIEEKQLPEHRLTKAFNNYKITSLAQLTDAQARRFIFHLERV
jgi:phage recombination protein Bet